MSLRLIAAIVIAKAAMFLSRLTGRGRGSSLPGKLALRVYPALLKHFQGQPRKGVIMVTGTNGKTTTSNMLSRIIEQAGYKVVANREGANLITGIAAAFIKFGTVTARVDSDYAVLEVDEAAFPGVAKWIKPDCVVVTNFFRDQLDRYGELDTTISKVLTAIKVLPPNTLLVLNADDPLVARFAGETGYPVQFYGILPDPRISSAAAYSREGKFCPFCGAALAYDLYVYSQLGDYHCPGCAFSRPRPDTEAVTVRPGGTGINAKVRSARGEWTINLPVRGIYNLYNALAAFTAAVSIGISSGDAVTGLQQYVPATGRMEPFQYQDKTVTLTLVKNPTGFNQALAHLLGAGVGQDVLMAINDNDADGRDISWLWDVDFEILSGRTDSFYQFICSGQRAEDMALRLKYAGVPVQQIVMVKDLHRAIEETLNGRGKTVGILATYTALWPVEKILGQKAERVKQGGADRLPSVS